MMDPFANTDDNLGRAAWIAVLGVIGSAPLAFILESVGIDAGFSVLFTYAAFIFVAWFMSKAARTLGRNPWLYGLGSLLPPLALLAFISLYSRDMDIRLARQYGPRHDA